MPRACRLHFLFVPAVSVLCSRRCLVSVRAGAACVQTSFVCARPGYLLTSHLQPNPRRDAEGIRNAVRAGGHFSVRADVLYSLFAPASSILCSRRRPRRAPITICKRNTMGMKARVCARNKLHGEDAMLNGEEDATHL